MHSRVHNCYERCCCVCYQQVRVRSSFKSTVRGSPDGLNCCRYCTGAMSLPCMMCWRCNARRSTTQAGYCTPGLAHFVRHRQHDCLHDLQGLKSRAVKPNRFFVTLGLFGLRNEYLRLVTFFQAQKLFL